MMLKLIIGASVAVPEREMKDIAKEVPAIIVDGTAIYVFVPPRMVTVTVSVAKMAVFGTVKVVHEAVTPAAENRVIAPDVLLPVVGAGVVPYSARCSDRGEGPGRSSGPTNGRAIDAAAGDDDRVCVLNSDSAKAKVRAGIGSVVCSSAANCDGERERQGRSNGRRGCDLRQADLDRRARLNTFEKFRPGQGGDGGQVRDLYRTQLQSSSFCPLAFRITQAAFMLIFA